MRRSSLLLGSALIGLAVAPIPHAPAGASCAGPYLEDAEHLQPLAKARPSIVAVVPRVRTPAGARAE